MNVKQTNWFTVRNAADTGATEILIYDQIGKSFWDDSGTGAKEFAEALKEIPRTQAITVRINSPGGSVSDGLAIYNSLRARASSVKTVVDGYALSAASIIALAGRTLEMPRNAIFMMHNPSGFADGDANTMRKMASLLDTHRDALATIYQAKSGKPLDEIKAAMEEETWFTGEEAHAYGFVDTLTEEISISASFDPAKLKLPARAVDSLRHTTTHNVMNIESQLIKTQAELAQATTERDASRSEVKALVDSLAEARTKVESLQSDLATARQTIGTLEAAARDHAAQLEAMEKDVDLRANAKAAEIARAQGVPAVVEENAGVTHNVTDLESELMAIKDPVARTHFARANRAALRNASDAARATRK